jgi:hypothetical protein
MNFALSTKYPEIDFENVSLTDLRLIGGGCGGDGGGGGSTTVSIASIQAAAQSAAAAPGASAGSISFGDPVSNYDVVVRWTSTNSSGGAVNGTAWIDTKTGAVSTVVMENRNGGFWASVSGFFGWLFGSH